jgi:hypothetical protein
MMNLVLVVVPNKLKYYKDTDMKVNKENYEWAWKMALTEQVLENDSIINKSEAIMIINESVGFDKIKTYLSEKKTTTWSSGIGDNRIKIAGNKYATRANTGQINRSITDRSRNALIATGVVALVAASFYVYKNYLTKASLACNKFSGDKKQICKVKFKIAGCDAAIKKLQSSMKLCKGKKNPEKCANSLNKQIEKWNARKSKYASKMNRWQQ